MIHGATIGRKSTSEYVSWSGMHNRCRNPNWHGFLYYGGRGIKVCRRWRKFENFLADMGRKPSRRYTIERRNNDGNYEPLNCKWATRKEQARNKRKPSKPNKRLIDLIGARFGRLTAIERLLSDKWGQAIWLCKCDCGEKIEATGGNLRSGNTQSCGCLQREKAALIASYRKPRASFL